MDDLAKYGISQDTSLRNYCQTCVLASQLLVGCIEHGMLLSIILVPCTNSFFMIDLLKSEIQSLYYSFPEAARQEFQKDINVISKVSPYDAINGRNS